MQEIRATGAAGVERVLANPGEWALFLDIDGTLLDLAPTPDATVVPPGLVQTLARLATQLGGAMALITGRRVADADRFFAPMHLVVSGVHGTEARTRPDGGIVKLAAPVPPVLLEAIRDVARLAPGVLVEDKGAGVAVHYRNAPESAATLARELERIVRRWEDFTLRPGRKVLELLPKAYSKATGFRQLVHLPAFHGRRPVMIGDDRGDEPAFREAEALGGIGLKVAGEHFSRAGADFDGAASVRTWLTALSRQTTAGTPPAEEPGPRLP